MASMHFWGVEVKGKEPNSVKLEEGQVIHVSQATLGEVKKDNEPVTVHVKVGDKKFVMGILSQNNPQLSFDLVFDEDFEISHNWKNGSVHLLGYQPEMNDEEDFSDFSDEDEDMPVPIPIENGKPAAPAAAKAAVKPNKDNKPKPVVKAEDEADSDDDDSEDDDDIDEEMLGGSDESDEEEGSEDDDDDDEEEDTPKPKVAEAGKKRSKPDAKTPEPKKAKLVTPQKTDGKKGGGAHTATPHPSKKGGKTPGADKSTPKSGGQISCGPCNRTFNSDGALQSHNKAKHGAK